MANDDFSDIDVHGQGFGVLHGGGTDSLEMKDKVTQAGPECVSTCIHCGTGNRVIISWEEVVAVSIQMVPVSDNRPWIYTPQNGGMLPPTTCRGCHEQLQDPVVTPDRGERWLKKGIQSGILRAPWVQQKILEFRRGAAQHR